MKKTLFLTIILAMTTAMAHAQDFSAYEKKWLIQGPDTMGYRLLLPLDYDASKKYPLLFFMHGSGERGNDNEAQLMHGGSLFLNDTVRRQFPAIIVFPQCPANSYWSNVQITSDSTKRLFHFQEGGAPTRAMAMAEALLDKLQADYPVDESRIYVGGLSMGGMGTFEIVRRHPELFAAAMPICGGAHPATAKQLKQPKWWVFHGDVDAVVPVDFSRQMVAALKAAGASVQYTEYPGVNHNSWNNAFAEKDLLPWLFAQHK